MTVGTGIIFRGPVFSTYPSSELVLLQEYFFEAVIDQPSALIKWLSGEMPICTEATSFNLQV
jgi:hypothetical protein